MQVWHIWNVRTRNNSLFQQGIFSNPAVFGGIVWELSIMCIVVYVPWSYSLNNTLFQAYEVSATSYLGPSLLMTCFTYARTLTHSLTYSLTRCPQCTTWRHLPSWFTASPTMRR